MTCLRTNSIVPVIALALAACASPAKPPAPAVAQAAPAAEKPEYKKPVRMNGRGEVTSISMEDFFQLQQSGKALIFDARPAFFYNLGHIPGAISLPKNQCDAAIAAREAGIKSAIAGGRTIVVYCTSLTCPDARAVAMHISGFGYPASIFSGGWDAWKEAGLPAE